MKGNVYALRLLPGSDLRLSIEDVVREQGIAAGWIITCVGSLSHYNLRFANQKVGSEGSGAFEILGLVGTLSVNGCHLHISLGNHAGSAIGGHLLPGCIVYTTAEIIIGTAQEFIFNRETDPQTGWNELTIQVNKNLPSNQSM
jgi:predicted DNA-binding protein with PD1-like motif